MPGHPFDFKDCRRMAFAGALRCREMGLGLVR